MRREDAFYLRSQARPLVKMRIAADMLYRVPLYIAPGDELKLSGDEMVGGVILAKLLFLAVFGITAYKTGDKSRYMKNLINKQAYFVASIF